MNTLIVQTPKYISRQTKNNQNVAHRQEFRCQIQDYHLVRSLVLGKKSLAELTKSNCHLQTITENESRLHPLDFLHQDLEHISMQNLKMVGSNQIVRTLIPLALEGDQYQLALDKTYFPRNHFGLQLNVDLLEKDDESIARLVN